MKICLINNLYPPYNKGGAEKVVEKMYENFSLDGHEVFIITTKPRKPRLKSERKEKIIYINSNYYNLGKKNVLIRIFWHLNNIFSFKKYNKILKILSNEKPDIVISHNLMGVGFMTFQAINISGIKHYHFLHDVQLIFPSGLIIFGKENQVNSWPARIYRLLIKKVITKPDLIISPSNWLIKEHQQRGMFVDCEKKIRPLNEIFRWEEYAKELNRQEYKNFIFAGQIEHHKGIIFLINAFKEMADKHMSLKIAGSGKLEGKVKELTKNDSRFQTLGKLDKEELNQELKKSDALIVPSLCYENTPLIITEAKKLGLKVIASDIGGIPEIIRKDDKLFIPNSKKDLFDKINELNK